MSGPSSPAELDPTTGDSLARIARAIPAGSEVLELGPGPGTLTRHLQESRGCQVDCVELAPDMAASARRWARDLWEADLDASDLADLTGGRTYDAVVTADVLEHLADPVRVLEQCRARLRPDGDLFLSLPNVGHAAVLVELLDGRFPYRDFGLLDRTHRWFFTRRSALDLLRETGFRVERVDAVTRMPETTEFGRRLDQLSSSLRTELLHHTDALTYQFMVRAQPGTMDESEWAALLSHTPPPELSFRAKLYWAPVDGEGSEELHVSAFGRLGDARQTLTFQLPDEPAIGALRFDPAEGPGFAHIYSIEVRRGAKPVLRLDGPGEVAAQSLLHGIEALPADGGFLMKADDPFLQLPMREPLAAGPERAVVVEMSWPASRDYTLAQEQIDTLHLEAQARDAAHAAEVEALRSKAEARVRAVTEELEATRQNVRTLEDLLHRIQQSKGWRALEWLRSFKPGGRKVE